MPPKLTQALAKVQQAKEEETKQEDRKQTQLHVKLMDTIRQKYSNAIRPSVKKQETSPETAQKSEADKETKQLMQYWFVNLCKDRSEKQRWKHDKYQIPSSIHLTEQEKFNLHQLYTYDQFDWMVETKSMGVTSPFYDKICSFSDEALHFEANEEKAPLNHQSAVKVTSQKLFVAVLDR